MSRTMRYTVSAICTALVPAAMLLSHPHFRKSITAKLPAGLEVKFEYTTLPWNPAHLTEVKDGFVFHCGNATVELGAVAKNGSTEIPAGKYLLRARAKDVDHWTFLLVPQPPDRNTPPDMTKAIELPTKTSKTGETHDHLSLDLTPGHADTDGKALFVLSWGDRLLEGVLAEFPVSSPR
jgi:hypothetical protein